MTDAEDIRALKVCACCGADSPHRPDRACDEWCARRAAPAAECTCTRSQEAECAECGTAYDVLEEAHEAGRNEAALE